jgi:uncharacterized protein YcfJ
MNTVLRQAMAVAGLVIASQAAAEITFYEHEGYEGRSFNTEEQVSNFKRIGFNDRASSAVVERDWWEVCVDNQYEGKCVVLRPGRYPSLAAMGLNDRISSVRALSGNPRSDANPYLPTPAGPNDFHRRNFERTFEADVISVHAVVGPPEERCWVEREQVVQDRSRNNVPGAIFGALIGGILGHQVGGGRGQDVATVGGAVAGAAVGANVGRDGDRRETSMQDVQHCSTSRSHARPEYWDVAYTFRGKEHHVQMMSPPGATVTVNNRGEPRI